MKSKIKSKIMRQAGKGIDHRSIEEKRRPHTAGVSRFLTSRRYISETVRDRVPARDRYEKVNKNENI